MKSIKSLIALQSDILVSLFRFLEIAMKRESGVNPEQTRCCKLNKTVFTQNKDKLVFSFVSETVFTKILLQYS